MASNSPPYPPMKAWKLRRIGRNVYGPPHPVDGGNYASLFSAAPEIAEEVVRRWNACTPEKWEAEIDTRSRDCYSSILAATNVYQFSEMGMALAKLFGSGKKLILTIREEK